MLALEGTDDFMSLELGYQLGDILIGKIINWYLVPALINPVFSMMAKCLGHAFHEEM